jgi:hypothetical protein
MGQRKTIAFYGTCSARSELVLVSRRIGQPFRLRKIHARFADGCQNLLALAFVVSPDAQAPSSGRPTGVSLLAETGQVDYVVGNNDSKDLEHTVELRQSGLYAKVHADNDDFYAHAVDVQLTIEFPPYEEA